MFICTTYIISYYWSVGFKNESNVVWVTVLNLFFTAMFSNLSRNSLNVGVKSLLN
jgi:hypothetical protein